MAVEGCFQKLQQLFNINKNQSKSLPGGFKSSEHGSGHKNLSDEWLNVYNLIFKKIPRPLFDLDITYMRVLRSQELDFEHENTLGMRTEGLHVDFAHDLNFSPCA